MEARDFLARVKSRLDGRRQEAPLRWTWPPSDGDPADVLTTEMQAEGVRVVRLTRERIQRELKPWLDQLVLVTQEPEIPSEMADWVREAGGGLLVWPDVPSDQVGSVDVAVTGAFAGIASLGVVVMSSDPRAGRLPSLLPGIHLVLLAQSKLVPSLEVFFEMLDDEGEVPSNIIFVRGPSKTSDIGLELATGVHGPKEMTVFLIEDL